ncbi:MAG TPA: diphosphate--fructose-6-phosphate 1-phosphotransferase [Bryobacteraceae bacterium]|nr:diphosphate--fructose-6-phosphate 1-phosphotransferase [Bryobacteraceae bacterium]
MKASDKGRAVVAHSGGPTPVINASLAGVIEEAAKHTEITSLYGAQFGISGVLNEDFIDLSRQPEEIINAVSRTTASALGSSRREIKKVDLDRVLDIFAAHGARYFFYTGGNGSMGTAHQIQTAAQARGDDLRVIGIPKTIDNDLLGTDHSPGYPSTARFFAHAVRDIGADNRSLPGQVEIIEILGRNTGWLAAATSLARTREDDAPHLIYFPEQRLSLDRLVMDVERVYRRLNRCVVAVCEGQLNEYGEPFGADTRTGSRGSLAMNLAHRLAMLIAESLKIRARSEKPGLLGRASSAYVSTVDWEEARMCGQAAIQAALRNESGKMVTIVRAQQEPYASTHDLIDLAKVAYLEKPFPTEWRNAEGNDVLPAFREYILPLAGPVPAGGRLESIRVSTSPR